MSNCFDEIIGLKSISLYYNENAQITRPDLSKESEVNLTIVYQNVDSVELEMDDPKWRRVVSYSGNYRQNYFDEFTFLLHGIETEIPDIIKAMKNNRVGFLIVIQTTGNKQFIFPTPVFLNSENTKKIDYHTWNISLSYKIPTFEDKLTLLNINVSSTIRKIENIEEIQGVKTLAFYINDDVRIKRPDASKENEVDLIAHGTGSFIINEIIEQPKWERTIETSGNYKGTFIDKFSFILHGIENEIPEIILKMRNNRLGYVTEVVTRGNKSYVFPAPVFLDNENTKRIDSHSWNVSLGYRVPSHEDRLIKLNTIIMAYNYVLTGNNNVLAGGSDAIVIG